MYNSSPWVTYIKRSRSRHPSSSSTTAHALSLSKGAFSTLFTRRLVSWIHIDAHDMCAFYATFCTAKRVSNRRCRVGYLCAINHVDIGDASLCAETLKHCRLHRSFLFVPQKHCGLSNHLHRCMQWYSRLQRTPYSAPTVHFTADCLIFFLMW